MGEPDAQAKDAPSPPTKSWRYKRVALWVAAGFAALVFLLAAAILGLNTAPGRGLVVGAIEGLHPASGLKVSIGSLDGSLYRRLTVRDLVLSDAKGPFLILHETTLDWRPAALLSKHLQVESLTVDAARMLRAPQLKPSEKKKPASLPDLAITVRRLNLASIVLEAPLTGDRRRLALTGSADIADGDARVEARAQALMIDGHDGGDLLTVKLDARPKDNRLLLDAHLTAPQGGVVDRLAKLGAPLRFDLAGDGDWKAWNGQANARLADQALLDARLTARNGRFRAQGRSVPGLVLKGLPAQLTQPNLAFDVAGQMKDRLIKGEATVASDALRVKAAGALDLGRSRFDQLKIEGALLRPDRLAKQVRGQPVQFSLALDGAFDRPLIDYDLSAASIGFGDISVEGFKAQGKARVDANRTLRLPLHASAVRILGLDQAAGGPVRAVRIDGDLLVSAEQIASDNLRLRSDRLDATVVVALSPATGRYDAALKGRLNRYAIAGFGVLDLTTDAKLTPTGDGLFKVTGSVQARTTRIDNATALEALGGPAVVTAEFSRTPQGAFGVANLRLKAPKFQILDGGGMVGADGAIRFDANATSDQYGPLTLKVGGTIAAPVATLRAPRPNVGVQLDNLIVELRGLPSGYAVTARAGTPYGPAAADLGLQTSGGPLAIDIRKASLAGVTIAGRLQQQPAGPFGGVLTLSGSGLSGQVTLAAAGKVQDVQAHLRARNARLPVNPAVTIGQGSADLQATLYPGAPALSGKVQLADVRQGDLVLNAASVSGTYRAGRGEATLAADGRTAVPFSVKANADLTPDLIRITGQGAVSRTSFTLAGPAQVIRGPDGWRLAPTTLVSPQGRIVVSGEFGDRKAIHARLQDISLSIAQAFAPTLGIDGKASGVVDVTLPSGAGLPTGKAQLEISNFTRSGLATVSEPVDISLRAALAQTGGDLAGVIRRRGAVIGRLQAKLGPVETTPAPPAERIQAASIAGGLRYNGPAEVLWGLSGIKDQELSGPIAIGADIGGRLGDPKVTGVVKSQALAYQNTQFGTDITGIAIDGRFVDTRLDLTKVTARTPDGGAIAASGYADLSAAKGFPVDIRATLTRARLARSDTLAAQVSGTLSITNGKDKPALIKGELTVDEARYAVALQSHAEVIELQGVRRKGEALLEPKPPAAASSGPPSVWKLDIGVRADNQVFVTGMGLEAEWRSTLRITGDANNPVIVGDVRLVRGTYSFAGRRLDLSQGVIHLDGSNPPNPTIDLQATTTVQGVATTINIGGSATRPEITFSSTPSLPQDEVLSRLLFGSSVTQLSPLQAVQLAAALNSLRGGGGGLNPLGKLRQAGGLDRLRFLGADAETGRGPSVGAGKYLGNNVYVEVTTDARGFTATQIEVALSKTLRLLSQVGALGGSNVTLRYSRDY